MNNCQEDDYGDFLPEAQPVYGDCRAAMLVRVHDGDTIIVNVPRWPAIVGRQIEVRLWGYDAPEIDDPRPDIRALAKQAKARLAALLQSAPLVLTSMRRDKYFRVLAGYKAAGVDVGAKLAAEGLVRPYTGQGPKPW